MKQAVLILICTLNASPLCLRSTDAKLLLWPEQDEEEYLSGQLHEKRQQKRQRIPKEQQDFETPSVRDRLRLFHHHDDSLSSKQSSYTSNLSPTRYLTLMLHYLQNQISTLSSHLYPSSWSAYSLFRQSQYQAMMAEPKDAWEGLLSAFSAIKTGYVGGMRYLVDGVYELGCSSIAACTALLPGQRDGKQNEYAPLSLFLFEFGMGLTKGAQYAKDGVLLFTAGAVVGVRNLMVGIARTPEAVRSARLGMLYYPWGKGELDATKQYYQAGTGGDGGERQVAVWDYYSLDYEDKEIQLEESRLQVDKESPRNNKSESLRKRRRSVPVKDSKFYDILGISTDANTKEIRSAYRKEALRRHPDKQTSSVDNQQTTQSTSIEGFLDLTEAYRILSDDSTRNAYDEYGVCFQSRPNDTHQAEATRDLIGELFGVDAVQKYVGNIEIASIVNEIFGFSEADNNESTEVKNLRQRRRVVDIAKHLRATVDAFVKSDMTSEQFTLQCQKEVEFIFREGGDVNFVAVIGRTLSQEADQRLGHVLPFVKRVSTDFAQSVSSKVASARVYGPIYFRVALEGLVSGSHYDKTTEDGDCDNRSGKHPVDQDAVLDLLWKYVVNDTVGTLREACDKVFADRGVRDGSLAFVKTQSLLKYQRAEAVRILGREFLAAAERERK